MDFKFSYTFIFLMYVHAFFGIKESRCHLLSFN